MVGIQFETLTGFGAWISLRGCKLWLCSRFEFGMPSDRVACNNAPPIQILPSPPLAATQIPLSFPADDSDERRRREKEERRTLERVPSSLNCAIVAGCCTKP
jgi:hypothetical protein